MASRIQLTSNQTMSPGSVSSSSLSVLTGGATATVADGETPEGGSSSSVTTAEESSVAETTSFYHKLQSEINVLRSRVDQQLSRMLTASAKEIETLSTQLLNLQQTPASSSIDQHRSPSGSRKDGGASPSLTAMQLRTRAVRWREQRLRNIQRSQQQSPTSQTTSTSATTSVAANTTSTVPGGGGNRRHNNSKRLNRPSPYSLAGSSNGDHQYRRIGASESSESSSFYLNQQVNGSLRISSSTITAPTTNLTRHSTARKIHNLTWEERSVLAAAETSIGVGGNISVHREGDDTGVGITNSTSAAPYSSSSHRFPLHRAATDASSLSTSTPGSHISHHYGQHPIDRSAASYGTPHHAMHTTRLSSPIPTPFPPRTPTPQQHSNQYNVGGLTLLSTHNMSTSENIDNIYDQQIEVVKGDGDEHAGEVHFLEEGEEILLEENPSGYGDDDLDRIMAYRRTQSQQSEDQNYGHHNYYDDYAHEEPFDLTAVDEEDDSPIIPEGHGPSHHLDGPSSPTMPTSPIASSEFRYLAPQDQSQLQLLPHAGADDSDGGDEHGYDVDEREYEYDDEHQYDAEHGYEEDGDVGYYGDNHNNLESPYRESDVWPGDQHSEAAVYSAYSRFLQDEIKSQSGRSGIIREEEPDELDEDGEDADFEDQEHREQDQPHNYNDHHHRIERLPSSSSHGVQNGSPPTDVLHSETGNYNGILCSHINQHAAASRQRRLFFPDDNSDESPTHSELINKNKGSDGAKQLEEGGTFAKLQETSMNASPGRGNKQPQEGDKNTDGSDRYYWLAPLANGNNESDSVDKSSAHRSGKEMETTIQGIIGHLASTAAQRKKWDAPVTAPRRLNGAIPLEPDSSTSSQPVRITTRSQTSDSPYHEAPKHNSSEAAATTSTQYSRPPTTITSTSLTKQPSLLTSVTLHATTETAQARPTDSVPSSSSNSTSRPPSSIADFSQDPFSISQAMSNSASDHNQQEKKDDSSSIRSQTLKVGKEPPDQPNLSANRTTQEAWDQLQDHSSLSNASSNRAVDEASLTDGVKRVVRVSQVKNKLMTDPYDDLGFYTGMLVRGKPNGPGVMMYFDGRRYEGEWKLGHWDGRGMTLFSNGDTYVGEYKMDERYGVGRYEWRDGRVYTGEFVHDNREGQGTYTFPDGSVYTGGFMAGQRHGHGCYKFVDSSVYTGEFKEGKYHGIGECKWADGRCYRGEWLDGRAHGYGVERRADGIIRHDGEWHCDRPVRRSRREKKIASSIDKGKLRTQADAEFETTKSGQHSKCDSLEKKASEQLDHSNDKVRLTEGMDRHESREPNGLDDSERKESKRTTEKRNEVTTIQNATDTFGAESAAHFITRSKSAPGPSDLNAATTRKSNKMQSKHHSSIETQLIRSPSHAESEPGLNYRKLSQPRPEVAQQALPKVPSLDMNSSLKGSVQTNLVRQSLKDGTPQRISSTARSDQPKDRLDPTTRVSRSEQATIPGLLQMQSMDEAHRVRREPESTSRLGSKQNVHRSAILATHTRK